MPATEQDGLEQAVGLPGWREGLLERTATPDPAWLRTVADLLDGPPADDALPPGWMDLVFAAWPDIGELGPDGHPRAELGALPLEGRRRLFGGGRLDLPSRVPCGAALTRSTHVSGVRVVAGRSGRLAVVTLRHEYRAGPSAVAVEEQDLIYRPPARPLAAGVPMVDAQAGPVVTPDPDRVELRLDVELARVFRFSALTANSHRIHYDHSWAVGREGLPGVLVQGPFLAMMMLELARRLAPEAHVARFSYRALRPAVAPYLLTAAVLDAPRPGAWSVGLAASGVRVMAGEIDFAQPALL